MMHHYTTFACKRFKTSESNAMHKSYCHAKFECNRLNIVTYDFENNKIWNVQATDIQEQQQKQYTMKAKTKGMRQHKKCWI